MPIPLLWSVTLALLLLSPFPSMADVQDESAIDIQVREIAKTLRCTVCQTENIWESGAPLAQQMRGVIRERLALGHSKEEIRAYFLSRYGDYILMAPPKSGVNWLIWVAPFLLLLIGGLFLYKEVTNWVQKTPDTNASPPPPLDDQARKRIEQELEP